MTAKTAERAPDMEVILSEPKTVKVDGIECTVRHMKTRELFAFLGVFTRTLGSAAAEALSGMKDKKPEELQGDILGLVLVCAPEAVDPLLKLVKDLVDPVDSEKSHVVRQYLDNPEIDDLLEIVDAVLENEKDNLADLLGKVRMYLTKWTGVFRNARGQKSST